jgi:hypothetical protein
VSPASQPPDSLLSFFPLFPSPFSPSLSDVGRGYGSPPPSHSHDQVTNLDGSVFVSNNQLLQSVRNTTKSWSRTASAPLYSNELVPFCGLRPDLILQDENCDPSTAVSGSHNTLIGEAAAEYGDMTDEAIGVGDLKRSREDVLGDCWAEEEESDLVEMDSTADGAVDKPIATLPRRSTPTTQSSFGLDRGGAQTLPISSGLSSYLSSGQDFDFSSYTNKADF